MIKTTKDYWMTASESKRIVLEEAEEYMMEKFTEFNRCGENMFISSHKGKPQKIKSFDDSYFNDLINNLSKQTYDEQSYLSEYYSNEWIKFYTLILVKRRRNKIDKLKKNINGI